MDFGSRLVLAIYYFTRKSISYISSGGVDRILFFWNMVKCLLDNKEGGCIIPLTEFSIDGSVQPFCGGLALSLSTVYHFCHDDSH